VTDIPVPTDTGSSGDQKPPSTTVVIAQPANPLEGLPLVRAFEGLAATNYRSMGGEVVAGLVAGSMSQLAQELENSRKELRESRKELRTARDDLATARQATAVLRERLNGSERHKQLRNFSIAAGTILMGVGIELLRNNFVGIAVIVGVVGVLLVVFGWFSSSREEMQQ
jgi:hypothetical protein